MKSTEIRARFLKFFERHAHTIVASGPLVPTGDKTLLFANAGMVQFKDVFLGAEKRPYVRAASSQCCMRAGGKHNDLENVGYTARHHTFFEMLGNFSFGDYFKREAIHFAWDFLTKGLKLPAERLWVTVYRDDDEAADIWLKELKVDAKRFSRLGEESNFWSMGDVGPCGPCSEIFYDHGAPIPGGPPGSPDEDGDRYVEIWNLVFMQYNRDSAGKLTPLPKPSVDTGMGLERVAAVMQGVHSNYQIDLFRHLTRAAADILRTDDLQSPSLNVIGDHIRAAAFLISEGVLPSNEGRGYVLRRIIRRAIHHGHKLGGRETFFYRLVEPLVEEMGKAYPGLVAARPRVETTLKQEEERFNETLDRGLGILDEGIAALNDGIIPGELIFKLYDTYGLPFDVVRDIALERKLKFDSAGFEREMEAQRERARAGSRMIDASLNLVVPMPTVEISAFSTEFTGYGTTQDKATIQLIVVNGKQVDEIRAGEKGILYLDRTPFYAESGGQVGDQGQLKNSSAIFDVLGTQKGHTHIGKLDSGQIRVGDRVTCEVDPALRSATMRNHSATHLMHKALRDVLGPHVQQKGSLVDAQRTRFDFSHSAPLTAEQIAEVERRVNDQILRNEDTSVGVMNMDQAMANGAMALFGEKYGDEVRVLTIGDSIELCGGTHVRRTGDIGLFKIISQGGVASGVRRIEAVTGLGALAWVQSEEADKQRIEGFYQATGGELMKKIAAEREDKKALQKKVEQLQAKFAAGGSRDLAAEAKDIHGVKVLATQMDGVDAKGLREAVDRLKDKLGRAAIVLASVADNKVTLIAGVTKDLMDRVPAGELVNQVALRVGGKGGGRPDMAQAGGNDPSGLEAALADVPQWVESRLK